MYARLREPARVTKWIGKQCCLCASSRENYLTRCSVVHQSNVEKRTGKFTWEELWLYVYLNYVFRLLYCVTLLWLCTDKY